MNLSECIAGRQNELDLISAATLAPSSHNTQPWRFKLNDRGFDLIADRTRALPINDPDDRELTISCGCALFNSRVAAAHTGLRVDVSLLPQQNDPDLLARIELLGSGAVPHELSRLHSVLALRRSYRQAFAPVEVTPTMKDSLVDAAEYDQAWIKFLNRTDERHELAELVAKGDSLQWDNAAWRKELSEWLRPRKGGDGLNPPGLSSSIGRQLIKRLNMGASVASHDRRLIEDAPAIAVIGTNGRHQPVDWLVAGMALQHVLLAAAFHGLQASYLNQPVQVADLRPRLKQVIATEGEPQVVLRLGMASSSGVRTVRRTLESVLDCSAS
ncbi:MAG: hypothetical protein AB8C46_06535 [Burkholderiaceae bacterium]